MIEYWLVIGPYESRLAWHEESRKGEVTHNLKLFNAAAAKVKGASVKVTLNKEPLNPG